MSDRVFFANIIFCENPLYGFYRCADYFQLYPVPEGFNIMHSRAKHFPIILEYWVDKTEIVEIKDDNFPDIEILSIPLAATNKLNYIVKILNSFTKFHFINYKVDFGWYYPILPENSIRESELQQSFFGLKIYSVPGIERILKISNFTKTNIASAKIENFKSYFSAISDDTEINISFLENMDLVVDKLFNIDPLKTRYANSALTLIENGINIEKIAKSLSFLSFVSSIETLSDYENRNSRPNYTCGSCKTLESSPHKCHQCGKPIWGVARQFRSFLEKYVNGSKDFKDRYSRFYNIRSGISHLGKLLTEDVFLKWDSNNKEDQMSEDLKFLKRICRIALVRWIWNED